jgi:hypothetical protein
LQYTHKVLKPALVKLTFSHILQLLGMIAWGVGVIPFNVQAKLEHDEKTLHPSDSSRVCKGIQKRLDGT